jgi:hypothetical protein
MTRHNRTLTVGGPNLPRAPNFVDDTPFDCNKPAVKWHDVQPGWASPVGTEQSVARHGSAGKGNSIENSESRQGRHKRRLRNQSRNSNPCLFNNNSNSVAESIF